MKYFFLILSVYAGFLSTALAELKLDYRTDVAPLLRDYCAGCHNDFDREGEFSVETFGSLMKGGETEGKRILVPGEPAGSYLLQTMRKTAKPAMPPKREPQLSKDEIDVIARWIEEGAVGPEPEMDLSILSTLSVPEMAPSGNAAEPITALALSPDGKTKAVARFGRVDVEDLGTGKVVRSFPVEDGKVNAVHFSPDGKRLVAATGLTGLRGVAIVWNLADGSVFQRFGEESHRDILFDAEFTPDGTKLATAGYDRIIRLWEVESGKYLRQFPSHNGAVFDLAFSPDGKILASASADSTCKIWEVETGQRFDTLNQPQGEQFRVDFTPDGKFIVGVGADNRIRLWRFLSREKPSINPVVQSRFGHENEIVEMALSGDGKALLTASADKALKLWSLPSLELKGIFTEQPDVISSLAFMSDGKVAAARLDGSFEIMVAPAELAVAAKEGSVAGSELVAVSPDMPKEIGENEGGEAPVLPVGATGKGIISKEGDVDSFLFPAKKGETIIFETNAARAKSKLDPHLAVYDAGGNPVERVVLQAVRDSWLTFRGKDSMASGDFRVHNWREMDLNEYLYVNGEVVKLWHYPRGPDSGFLVYPGFGNRHTYFETTSLSHPLGQPCYIVRPLPAGSEPGSNGLPIYRIFYENDDDATRELGKDSRLTFTAPADGTYDLRIRDVRGFGGDGFTYSVIARKPKPDFSISIAGKDAKISPGSGRELMFTAKRLDGFSGPIQIRIEGLPDELTSLPSVTIEENQYRAFTPLHLRSGVETLTEEQLKGIRLTASAKVNGKMVEKPLGGLGKIEVGPAAKVLVQIESDGASGRVAEDGVLEFTVTPGETITARVVAQRLGFEERIDLGKEDSGRNLPHGLYVDNIGLNGLMIPVGKSEQRFFITAAKWVPATVREFHLQTTADGKQVSKPARIRVVPVGNVATK
jgi:WD40 repeat protein